MGSVNLAELMAYVHALTWFHATHGAELLARRGRLSVQIITDSQITVTTGRHVSAEGELPSHNRAFWAAIRETQRMGYCLNWTWAERNSSYANWLCDCLSSVARRQAMSVRELCSDANGRVLPLLEPEPQEQPT